MALTLSGHRRFAPMFKIAPGDFVTFVFAAAALLTARTSPSHIVTYAPWVSVACRLAATAITLAKCSSYLQLMFLRLDCLPPGCSSNYLAKYAELYEKLGVCLQQS
jgi:hypothetical protein